MTRTEQIARAGMRVAGTMCWVLLVVFGLGACQAPPGPPVETSSPTPVPVKKAPKMPTATLPNGAVITLELAISPEERQQGLMFRPKLPVDRGMLFLFEREGMPGIWMKNTLIPLDLIYLDQQGRIVDIIEKVQPCKADPCPNYQATKPASAVLELAAGVVEEQGLRTGDRLAFAKVPGLPRVPSAG